MKEIIVNAQWQGGGDTNTYYGANELINLYLSGHDFRKLFVSLDKDGAAQLQKQTESLDLRSYANKFMMRIIYYQRKPLIRSLLWVVDVMQMYPVSFI